MKAQAVTILSEVVSSSENREAFAGPIVGSYKSAVDDETRSALLRLLGAAGGEDAAAIVKEAIEGDNTSMQLSAIAALKQWPDGSQFEILYEFADGQEDDTMRREAFEAMINFLTKPKNSKKKIRKSSGPTSPPWLWDKSSSSKWSALWSTKTASGQKRSSTTSSKTKMPMPPTASSTDRSGPSAPSENAFAASTKTTNKALEAP